MTDWIVAALIKKRQDETLNAEDHIWIKKDTKAYLDREKGEIKIV